MVGLTERLLNEGMQKGRQEGIEAGIQKGELNMLIRQLTRRFGPLDAATLQRLQHAGSDDLERWADNILDAKSLDEVFTSRRASRPAELPVAPLVEITTPDKPQSRLQHYRRSTQSRFRP